MAISVAARKNKGRKCQQDARDRILAIHPELTCDDCRSTAMGSAGVDIQLSARAKELHPFSYECKHIANGFAEVYKALDQADRNDGATPLVFAKRDRSKPFVAMYADDFYALISKIA